MPNSSANELAGRFHGVLNSLHEFDNIEVHGVVEGLLSPTDREKCFIGLYYRALANVRTLLTLTNPSHFQAISMLARTMFELAVDSRLMGMIPDATEKVLAFHDVERLRAARKVLAFAKNNSTTEDVSIFETFIATNEMTIDALHKALWPKHKKLSHWSAMHLGERVKILKAPFDEVYESHYPRLSWAVHSGLTGVLNLDADGFTAMCGVAMEIAIDSYIEVLRAVIVELKIDKGVDKIDNKLQLAKMLPFTNTPYQQIQLRNHLLG